MHKPHYCLKVWGQLKEMDYFIQQKCIKLRKSYLYYKQKWMLFFWTFYSLKNPDKENVSWFSQNY